MHTCHASRLQPRDRSELEPRVPGAAAGGLASGAFPASPGLAVAEAGVTAAVHDVGAREVADRHGQDMDKPAERPERDERPLRKDMNGTALPVRWLVWQWEVLVRQVPV